MEHRIPDTLLLLEHPPTITLGRGTKKEHLLISDVERQVHGVALVEVDRGGDITYHGPGQLVGYPIFDLTDHRKDLHWYLREIEACLIELLAEWNIVGSRFPPHTGVWVEEEKIAAIGIKAKGWVTMHGFALNVSPRLADFDWIVPCGIRDYGVTSMERILGSAVETLPAARRAAAIFARHFGGVEDIGKVPSSSAHSVDEKNRPIFFAEALDLLSAP
jgi:lipoate-protein ligase B